MFKFMVKISQRLQLHNVSNNNQMYRCIGEKCYATNTAKLTKKGK